MNKVKTFNFSFFLTIIKSCLIGLISTLVGIVIFAVILKFVDLSSAVVGYINDAIKAVSIFLTISCVKKSSSDKLIYKSILAGVVYAALTYVIFSILNGGFVFNLSIIYDMLFAVVVAMIITIILNLFSRKNA